MLLETFPTTDHHESSISVSDSVTCISCGSHFPNKPLFEQGLSCSVLDAKNMRLTCPRMEAMLRGKQHEPEGECFK